MDDYSAISHDSDSVPHTTEGQSRAVAGSLSRHEQGIISSKDYSAQYISLSPRVLLGPTAGSDEGDMPLRVTPSNLRFEALEPGVLYVMTFSIKNATKFAERVRISTPNSSYFALNYIPAGPLAPGLDLRAEIECQLPEDREEVSVFTDKIVVSMGAHKVEVPLYACKPGPDIVFNSNLNFGLVVQNVATTKRLAFKNRGVDVGIIMITLPQSTCYRAIPSSFELRPGEEQIIQFRVESDVLGPIREIATVHIEGLHESLPIDLSAQIVVQNVSLVSTNKGGLIDNLDLGYIFFGEVRETEAFLLNNGPTQLAYTVLFENEESQQSNQSVSAEKDRCVTIIPPEGVLPPYSQSQVMIRYTPKIPSFGKGFSVGYKKEFREPQIIGATPIIEIPETGQRLEVSIQGAACLPDFTISPQILRFGKCAVYDRRDILVTFANKSNAKMSLEFNEIAHFKISPMKCVVQGGQAKTLVASFMPTQMGKFKSIFQLSIEGGITKSEIRLIGEADSLGVKKTLVGGPETLPSDFKKPYHFVDPTEIAAERYAKENSTKLFEKPAPAVIEIDSTSIDYLYDQTSSLAETLNHVDLNYSSKKIQNRKIYNDFLQKSHSNRLKKKRQLKKERTILSCGYDRSDPFGTDLGMERGLDEPDLKLPSFSEPLWLANRDSDGDGGRRVVFDEHRLISKKFPATPTSPSDVRDCASEVTFSEMKLVISSHKVK